MQITLIQGALLLGLWLLPQAAVEAQGIQIMSSSGGGCGLKTCPIPPLGKFYTSLDEVSAEWMGLADGQVMPKVGEIIGVLPPCAETELYPGGNWATWVTEVTGVELKPDGSGLFKLSTHSSIFSPRSLRGWPTCDAWYSDNARCARWSTSGGTGSDDGDSAQDTGDVLAQMPIASNEEVVSGGGSGCSTCGTGSASMPGNVSIAINLGNSTTGASPFSPLLPRSLAFADNLTTVDTLTLDKLGIDELLGYTVDATHPLPGSITVTGIGGETLSTMQITTTAATAPATDLQSIVITVTPVAGSAQPVTTHTFEKVTTSDADFTWVGIKYTRTEGSSSETLEFYNSGPGTCNVENVVTANGSYTTVFGSFKTVASNGDVQIWTAQPEAGFIAWSGVLGKWSGNQMEMIKFIPAASGQPVITTERHYGRIGGADAAQSIKVVTSETVTTKQGATVPDVQTTRHGYYESYMAGTEPDPNFGLERWQASTTGEWTLTLRGYVANASSPGVTETLAVTPWLDGPDTTGAFVSDAAAEAFFTGLAAQATGDSPQIAGCQITRTLDASELSVYPALPWSTREIGSINGVVTGMTYEINRLYLDNYYALADGG